MRKTPTLWTVLSCIFVLAAIRRGSRVQIPLHHYIGNYRECRREMFLRLSQLNLVLSEYRLGLRSVVRKYARAGPSLNFKTLWCIAFRVSPDLTAAALGTRRLYGRSLV